MPLIEETRVAGMLTDVTSRVGGLGGMLIDGMLKEGWLNVGTLFEGMLNDGLLTVEPPIEGTIFEGNPGFWVLPGGNPSVGILAVGLCPLGGLRPKARDADTHRRSMKFAISFPSHNFLCSLRVLLNWDVRNVQDCLPLQL